MVVADIAQEGSWSFQRRRFGTTPEDLRLWASFLADLGVQEAVMESTAQYWKPVWQELEGRFHLELAQALSNRGRRGRKSDFRVAAAEPGGSPAGEMRIKLSSVVATYWE